MDLTRETTLSYGTTGEFVNSHEGNEQRRRDGGARFEINQHHLRVKRRVQRYCSS